jgi:hypothetical protein
MRGCTGPAAAVLCAVALLVVSTHCSMPVRCVQARCATEVEVRCCAGAVLVCRSARVDRWHHGYLQLRPHRD